MKTAKFVILSSPGFQWTAVLMLIFSHVFPGSIDGVGVDDERRIRELEGALIAPCCWSQPVSVHRSGASDEVRAEIRRLVSEGLTNEEAVAMFVSKYGKRILAQPAAEGFDILVYVLPPAFLIAGGFLLKALHRHLVRGKQDQEYPAFECSIPSDLADRIEKDVLERSG